jgi:hypothetical protein
MTLIIRKKLFISKNVENSVAEVHLPKVPVVAANQNRNQCQRTVRYRDLASYYVLHMSAIAITSSDRDLSTSKEVHHIECPIKEGAQCEAQKRQIVWVGTHLTVSS